MILEQHDLPDNAANTTGQGMINLPPPPPVYAGRPIPNGLKEKIVVNRSNKRLKS
ncbi:hypothetical protein LINPERPRIM_LOCUS37320, partial [Linum perenne]